MYLTANRYDILNAAQLNFVVGLAIGYLLTFDLHTGLPVTGTGLPMSLWGMNAMVGVDTVVPGRCDRTLNSDCILVRTNLYTKEYSSLPKCTH